MQKKHIRKKLYFSFNLIALVLYILLPTSTVVLADPSDIFDTEFDAQVKVLMNTAKVESLALSIINGTEEYYATGYGKQPGTDIVYYLNDISGVIVHTTALLQLMEDGLFDINDPVNDYLPWILRNPHYPSIDITIYDILSHQAGIGYSDEFYEAYRDSLYPFPDLLYEVFNEDGSYYTADTWKNSAPGSNYQGQWVNYDFTAYLVELMSEEPYEQYVTNNIFTPLGMISTEFTYTNYTLSQLAKQYLWNSTSGVNEELSYRDTYLHTPGSAGVLSTVGDLSKFLIVHMNDGVYDTIRILEESSVNLMHTNLGDNRGLGWDTDINGYQGLVGSVFGDTFMLIKANLGVIIFTNQCLFLEGFAGKIRNIVNHITSTADELIVETTETNTETNNTSLSFIFPLGIFFASVISLKKRKKSN